METRGVAATTSLLACQPVASKPHLARMASDPYCEPVMRGVAQVRTHCNTERLQAPPAAHAQRAGSIRIGVRLFSR